jgi:hypothetical protein
MTAPVSCTPRSTPIGRVEASRLSWLPADLGKVPVDVYCSGPRMIELAATRADRLTLAVGSDLGDVGIFLPFLVHPDRVKAHTLVTGGVASVARLSVMHGVVTGPADEERCLQLEAPPRLRHVGPRCPRFGPGHCRQ